MENIFHYHYYIKNIIMIKISGTLGLTIVETNGNYFLFFFDDHNKTSYCDNDNNYFVDDFIKLLLKKHDNVCIFLEEYYNSDEYQLIWQNEHVKKLQSFVNEIKNKKVCYYLTDVRLLLIPISFELLDDKSEYIDVTVDVFFENVIKILYIKESKKDNLPKIIVELYDKIKKKINEYIIPYKNKTMRTYIKKIKKSHILSLMDDIMEFYSICKIYDSNSDINIIYYGLAHSLFFVSTLFKLFECKIILNNGITFTCDNNNIYFNNILIDEILEKQNFDLFKDNINCSIIS